MIGGLFKHIQPRNTSKMLEIPLWYLLIRILIPKMLKPSFFCWNITPPSATNCCNEKGIIIPNEIKLISGVSRIYPTQGGGKNLMFQATCSGSLGISFSDEKNTWHLRLWSRRTWQIRFQRFGGKHPPVNIRERRRKNPTLEKKLKVDLSLSLFFSFYAYNPMHIGYSAHLYIQCIYIYIRI